jgi:hypothetical protein
MAIPYAACFPYVRPAYNRIICATLSAFLAQARRARQAAFSERFISGRWLKQGAWRPAGQLMIYSQEDERP